MSSSTTTLPFNADAVHAPFRRWEAEQAELDAQIAESIEALVAYQSHLDIWQQQLAQEREELQNLRAGVEHDQALAGVEQERLDQVNRDLNDARQQVASLTAVLLARTEELREIDHQRGDANTELAAARTHERELTAALAAQQQSFATERLQFEKEIVHLRQQLERAVELVSSRPASRDEIPKTSATKSDAARSVNPVLGSVMEQFGKLRQQRSLNRPNPKLGKQP
jgi:chromosome segregation ATPase